MKKLIKKTNLKLPILLIILPIILIILAIGINDFALPIIFGEGQYSQLILEKQQRAGQLDYCVMHQYDVNPNFIADENWCGQLLGAKRPIDETTYDLYANLSHILPTILVIPAISCWVIGFIVLKNRLTNKKTNP